MDKVKLIQIDCSASFEEVSSDTKDFEMLKNTRDTYPTAPAE